MPAPRTAWIIGATSIVGYSILRASTSQFSVTPWCSRHHGGATTQGWRRLNVEDTEDWAPLQQAGPDYLLYCAGVCNVARCEADPHFARAINIGGVQAMLETLPAHTRLVYCSSDHVFGGNVGPCTESTPPRPISEYGRSRVEAEDHVRRARPDALIVRAGLPIGPSLSGRTGHLDWLRHRHRANLPMTVIDGEARAAVLADAAGQRIVDLAASDISGVRHLSATHLCPRPRLAAHLCARLGIDPPRYEVVNRQTLDYPHLGVVDLRTEYHDALARPLPSPISEPDDDARGSRP